MKNYRRANILSFIIVFALIIAVTFLAFFGAYNYHGDLKNTYFKGSEEIRWGLDISGGVEAIFVPDVEVDKITDDMMESAKSILEIRMNNQNITDHEIFVDSANKQIIVRFPWKADESTFDPKTAVEELGASAVLTFREGSTKDGAVILQGAADIASATAVVFTTESGASEYGVSLKLTAAGKDKFAAGTKKMLKDTISIWMDDTCISSPTVNEVITNGEAQITGSFDSESASDLANQINAGSLPFALTTEDVNGNAKVQVVTPTLGQNALNVMLIAALAAFAVVSLFMILKYRLPGAVAVIALIGQVGGMVACVTGFFPGTESFTLTIPGIAGIILSIGMGVDANVITAERIKDEFENGKTIDGAIQAGNENSWSSILDGNVTVIIVSLVLMGAFGNPDSIMAVIFSPIMNFFGSAVTGSIYSFGYTLLTGVIFNFVMGVFASRMMLKGLTAVKFLRKPWLFGGKKNA